jgi:hypothetical protein
VVWRDVKHPVKHVEQMLGHGVHVLVQQGQKPYTDAEGQQPFPGLQDRDASQAKMPDEETFRVMFHSG